MCFRSDLLDPEGPRCEEDSSVPFDLVSVSVTVSSEMRDKQSFGSSACKQNSEDNRKELNWGTCRWKFGVTGGTFVC